jgi:hypothetical protein
MPDQCVNVTTKGDLNRLTKLLKDLEQIEVLVGVPEAKSSRKSGEITNAELLYIHTHGSPLHHVPARPVVEAAIEYPENKQKLTVGMRKVGELILQNNRREAKKQVKVVGMMAQNMARDWFTNPANGWPPNAPSTIERKARKVYKLSRYKTEKTKMKYRARLGALLAFGVFNPLIDTAQLRKSIVYVVRDHGEDEKP